MIVETATMGAMGETIGKAPKYPRGPREQTQHGKDFALQREKARARAKHSTTTAGRMTALLRTTARGVGTGTQVAKAEREAVQRVVSLLVEVEDGAW